MKSPIGQIDDFKTGHFLDKVYFKEIYYREVSLQSVWVNRK